MRYLRSLFSIMAALLVCATPALSQDVDAEEKSRFVRFIEEQISSPNMQIQLNGLQGTLSSDVSLASITIADEDGVWLTLSEPRLVWNRSALLRGRLEVESLSAAQLNWSRMPAADESLPDAEAGGLAIPQLPVAVDVQRLALERAMFAQPVFGLEATLSLDGRLALADGNLDTELTVERLDGPGGSLSLAATYDAQARDIRMEVSLSEPADGVLVNLMSIHEKPAVALTISGGGPVEDLDLTLALDAAERRVLNGSLQLDDGFLSSDLSGSFVLEGALSTLLAPNQRAFFGQRSLVQARFSVPSEGGFEVDSFTVESGAVAATGRLVREASGFISFLNMNAELGLPDGMPVVIPGQAPNPSLSAATFTLAFDAGRSDEWISQLQVQDLRTQELAVPNVSLSGGGVVSDGGSGSGRNVTFDLSASAQGIQAVEAALQQALGDRIDASLEGRWEASGRTVLQAFEIASSSFQLQGEGAVEDFSFDGRAVAAIDSLRSFAALAERPLEGRAELALDGTAQLIGGGFDLAVDGDLQNVRIGTDQIDALLAGTAQLDGRARRDENGLEFDQLAFESQQARISLDGTYASDNADLVGLISINDLSELDDRAKGLADLTVQLDQTPRPAEGEPVQPLSISVSGNVSRASLVGRAVPSLTIGFQGQLTDGESLVGQLSGDGTVNGSEFILSSDIAYADGAGQLSQLGLSLGPTNITGDLDYRSGAVDGALTVRSTDISDLFALVLQQASGAVQAQLEFARQSTPSQQSDQQDVAFDARLSGFRLQDYAVGTGTATGKVQDVFGTPQITAEISARDATSAGVAINELDVSAATSGQAISVDAQARLNSSTDIATIAQITPRTDGLSASVQALSVNSPFGDTELLAPAQIDVADGVTRLTNIVLAIGGSGQIALAGTTGDMLDLSGTLQSVPLEVVNAFAPGTGLGGSLSGRFTLAGMASAPVASFAFDAEGVGANAMRQAGIAPLNGSASGRFEDQTVTLNSASVRNGSGLTADASGTIPLSGAGLRVDVRAEAPLSLANRFVASRGTRLTGAGSVTATVTGSLSDPSINGLVSVNGGGVTDPLSNLRLTNLNLLASLQGDRVSINRSSANLAGGGQISASGTVGLTAGLPADLAINLTQARYTDGEIFTVNLGANLTVTGPLASTPTVAGTIDIAEANITIPSSLSGAGDLLPVVHVNPSQPTLRTLARIEQVTPDGSTGGGTGAGPRLDIQINAPNRIFLRGRGVDAELGGQVRVQGPLQNLAPVGAFNLIRGRLSILSKRIVLTEGSVRLTGTLDPLITLVAQVQESDLTAFITLSGRASDLELQLTSSPELPDDEILAQILFGEGIGSLSPLQIASLASAAASLTTGGNGPGLADQIRQGLGVDDLDVVTDSDGNTAVRAGKYIQDNVYLETQAGANGAEVSINLDITRDLKAKGSVASDGNSKLGIFFEKDY
ncbi:MAG: translocation/assembly module TamB domain-containing protein [Pseudomonadota bacterium]